MKSLKPIASSLFYLASVLSLAEPSFAALEHSSRMPTADLPTCEISPPVKRRVLHQILDENGNPNPLHPTYLQIKDTERKLKEKDESFGSGPYSLDNFDEKVVKSLEKGESLDLDYLTAWDGANTQAREEHYVYTDQKLSYFVDRVHTEFLAAARSQELGWFKQRALNKKILEVESQYKKWNQALEIIHRRAQEGVSLTPKEQHDRNYAFYNFFTAVQNTLTELKLAPAPVGAINAFQPKKELWAATRLVFAENLGFKYLRPSYIRSLFAKKIEAPKPPVEGPLFKAFNQYMIKMGELNGYTVKVEGLENLEGIDLDKGSDDGKTINFFLPAHRSTLNDSMAMAAVPLPHALMFANPKAFVPTSFFANWLANMGEFVGVGEVRGSQHLDPTEKMMKGLKNHLTPNVINYPHGFVSLDGSKDRLNSHLVDKLLLPPLEKGFRENLIPITYDLSSPFLSRSGGADQKVITVKVGRPLRHPVVRALVEQELGIKVIEFDQLLSQVHSRLKPGEPIEKPKLEDRPQYIENFLDASWKFGEGYGELGIDELLERKDHRLGLISTDRSPVVAH